MPYTRPHTKDGLFRKHEYVYDEYYDCYICPAGQVLSYETTNRHGYRMYRSDPKQCRPCSFLSQCSESREAIKRISRHVWAGYVEEADHLRHTEQNKRLYARRKETIERVFADLKEKHGSLDHFKRTQESENASDALFRFHESKEVSQLALEISESGVRSTL